MGSTDIVVLDTHAWLWWLHEPGLLGTDGTVRINAAISSRTLMASAISAWEAATLAAKGRIRTTLPVHEIVAACEAMKAFSFAPVTASIAATAGSLDSFHGDPADRIITATAMHYGAVLVTKDRRIRAFTPVRTSW